MFLPFEWAVLLIHRVLLQLPTTNRLNHLRRGIICWLVLLKEFQVILAGPVVDIQLRHCVWCSLAYLFHSGLVVVLGIHLWIYHAPAVSMVHCLGSLLSNAITLFEALASRGTSSTVVKVGCVTQWLLYIDGTKSLILTLPQNVWATVLDLMRTVWHDLWVRCILVSWSCNLVDDGSRVLRHWLRVGTSRRHQMHLVRSTRLVPKPIFYYITLAAVPIAIIWWLGQLFRVEMRRSLKIRDDVTQLT